MTPLKSKPNCFFKPAISYSFPFYYRGPSVCISTAVEQDSQLDMFNRTFQIPQMEYGPLLDMLEDWLAWVGDEWRRLGGTPPDYIESVHETARKLVRDRWHEADRATTHDFLEMHTG